MTARTTAGAAARSERAAAPRPRSRTPRDAAIQNEAQRANRQPPTGARPSVSRVIRARSKGASATRTVSPPWPRTSAAVARAHGRATSASSRRRAGRARRNATPSPSRSCAPRNTLKNGTAAARTAARPREPRAARLVGSRVVERDERGEGDGQRRHNRVRVHERQEEVPAEEVGPPVGLRVRGEEERPVGRGAVSRARARRRAAARRAGARRPQCQRERRRPEHDVEAGERVPGVDPRPAERGRADEVGAEVIAEREARDARHLRRVADDQLARQADVERGVEVHERVEQEIAVPSVARRLKGNWVTASRARKRENAAASHGSGPRHGGRVRRARAPARARGPGRRRRRARVGRARGDRRARASRPRRRRRSRAAGPGRARPGRGEAFAARHRAGRSRGRRKGERRTGVWGLKARPDGSLHGEPGHGTLSRSLDRKKRSQEEVSR